MKNKCETVNDNIKADILEWMLNGEQGLSSVAMARCFSGAVRPNDSFPHDPSDLRRCVLFLEAVPTARSRMNELRVISSEWNALVDAWADLESSLRAECAEAGKVLFDGLAHWHARKTYAMMEAVIKKAREVKQCALPMTAGRRFR